MSSSSPESASPDHQTLIAPAGWSEGRVSHGGSVNLAFSGTEDDLQRAGAETLNAVATAASGFVLYSASDAGYDASPAAAAAATGVTAAVRNSPLRGWQPSPQARPQPTATSTGTSSGRATSPSCVCPAIPPPPPSLSGSPRAGRARRAVPYSQPAALLTLAAATRNGTPVGSGGNAAVDRSVAFRSGEPNLRTACRGDARKPEDAGIIKSGWPESLSAQTAAFTGASSPAAGVALDTGEHRHGRPMQRLPLNGHCRRFSADDSGTPNGRIFRGAREFRATEEDLSDTGKGGDFGEFGSLSDGDQAACNDEVGEERADQQLCVVSDDEVRPQANHTQHSDQLLNHLHLRSDNERRRRSHRLDVQRNAGEGGAGDRSLGRDDEADDDDDDEDEQEENMVRFLMQVIVPFIAAGFGTVAAGLLFDNVVNWPSYRAIPELVGLVPTLLGLKGNLEMTLTARLATAANMGYLDRRAERWQHVSGNLFVTQVQAVAVSFLASLISIAVYALTENSFAVGNTFVLCASALATAALASLLLGILMSVIVLLCRPLGLNPDNVSAPIAAALGDITTLALLSYISDALYSRQHVNWLSITIVVALTGLAPLWAVAAYRNRAVRSVLVSGWTPVLGAMAISQGAGYILERATALYQGMAVYQPVISGVGGNLVVVQTCRMTTFLGRRSALGSHPPHDDRSMVGPAAALCGHDYLARTARTLLALTLPGHLLFLFIIELVVAGYGGEEAVIITPLFRVFYLAATLLQVAILLYVARCMVYGMWRRGIDPDNAAIPYLTALGDLIGIALLALVFQTLHSIGDRSATLTIAGVAGGHGWPNETAAHHRGLRQHPADVAGSLRLLDEAM